MAMFDMFPDVWGDGPGGMLARALLTVAATALIMLGHP
jgi:hypothetical protein